LFIEKVKAMFIVLSLKNTAAQGRTDKTIQENGIRFLQVIIIGAVEGWFRSNLRRSQAGNPLVLPKVRAAFRESTGMTRWSLRILLLLLAGGCAQQEASRDPQADIADGWNYYRLGEFSIAINHFQRAALTANAPTRFEALYGLATTGVIESGGQLLR
jgi:hypothetical protein